MLKERCNANINSHRNPDVNDDSARGLTVSDNSENDVIKDTTTLEFLTKAKPRAATIGSLVRFMWNPGTGTSLCWVQGKICKRIDSFKKSRKEIWDSNRVVIQNLVIIDRWGEERIEKLPKSMIVDLQQSKFWAQGTEVTLGKIGTEGTLGIDTNKTTNIIKCYDPDTDYFQIKKAARNTVDTIKDDTENKADTGFESIMTKDNMKTDKTSNLVTIDNTKTIEGEDEAITIEFPRFDNIANDEKTVETAIIDHDIMSFNQGHEEPLITELEIWFNIEDLRIGIDRVEDDVYNDDVLSRIVFSITILPQGKGLRSLFQLDQESEPDCEGTELENIFRGFCDSTSNKELSGTITLVVGKREDGDLNVLNAYLNGVERRVTVDTGAAASIIHNNLDPRKDRKFKVLGVQSYYFPCWLNVYRRKDNSNMISTRENYLKCSEI